ncbi:MAG: hypothetical protein AAF202_04090, partial [Pseudomonadota bacterium]
HIPTLIGVLFGAKNARFEDVGEADGQGVEGATLGVDPLLRPPHGFANFGETDPEKVNPPVWLDFRPAKGNPPLIQHSDFRYEIYESLQQGDYVYEIWAANLINTATGEKNWEHVGNFVVEEAFLPSAGADQGIIIPHGDVTHRNYFTDKSIYEYIRTVNVPPGTIN